MGAKIVALSPSFSLSNTLLVLSFSNKLLSIGQATKELNCVALIYPTFFVFFRIFSQRKSIGVVLRKGGYTIWMTLVLVKQITSNTQLVSRKYRLGYGISIWHIHHSVI